MWQVLKTMVSMVTEVQAWVLGKGSRAFIYLREHSENILSAASVEEAILPAWRSQLGVKT